MTFFFPPNTILGVEKHRVFKKKKYGTLGDALSAWS
jgi:hypothetical protein